MRHCYDELDRPASAPLARLDQVFEPSDMGILDEFDGRWSAFTMAFPPEAGMPGDGQPVADLWEMCRRALTLHCHERTSIRASVRHRPPQHWTMVDDTLAGAVDVVLSLVLKTVEARVRRRSMPAERAHRRGFSGVMRASPRGYGGTRSPPTSTMMN